MFIFCYHLGMHAANRAMFRASLSMFGAIVGAGVFALPCAFAYMGLVRGSILFVVMALVVLEVHLFYIDIVRERKYQQMRFPSHVGSILGPTARSIAFLSHPGHIIGACLAYILLGGTFLSWLGVTLGLPLSIGLWRAIFWLGGALTVFVGMKAVFAVEQVFGWILIVSLVFLTGVYAQLPGSSLMHTSTATSGVLGVFLFSLFGLPAISEVSDLAGRSRAAARRAVALGSIGAAILMGSFAFFAARVIGSNGTGFTPLDFIRTLPGPIQWIIPLVGLVAVSTTFVLILQDLKTMLHRDAGWSSLFAWTFALGSPAALLLFTTNFATTIGFVGSLFSALNAFFVCWMAYRTNRSRHVAPLLMVFFSGICIWRILSLFL